MVSLRESIPHKNPMSARTLFDKVWDLHTVKTLPSGQTQLFIGLYLIHEITSPQVFARLRDRSLFL